MAYTNQMKVWSVSATSNVTASSSLGGTFIPGEPVVSSTFNGILKDVSLVTIAILEALKDVTTTDTSSMLINNEMTANTLKGYVSSMLTNLNSISINSAYINGLNLDGTLDSIDTTTPSSSSTNAAIKTSGGIYAAKAIRTGTNLIATSGTIYSKVLDVASNGYISVNNTNDVAATNPSIKTLGGIYAEGSIKTTRVLMTPAILSSDGISPVEFQHLGTGVKFVSASNNNIILHNPDQTGDANKTYNIKFPSLDVDNATATLATKSYEHNITISDPSQEQGAYARITFKLITKSNTALTGTGTAVSPASIITALYNADYIDGKYCPASGYYKESHGHPIIITQVHATSSQLVFSGFDLTSTATTTLSFNYGINGLSDHVREV